jgi:hypothetical protein
MSHNYHNVAWTLFSFLFLLLLSSSRYAWDIGAWTMPFVMAAINTRVVRRSASLLEARGSGYGPNFAYNE